MKWIKENGKVVDAKITKYIIDYSKPAPSKGATKVKEFLQKYCPGHLILEEWRIFSTLFRIDYLIVSAKIAIEFDGRGAHEYGKDGKPTFFFKNRIQYLNSIKREVKKEEMLEKNGFRTIRITDEDLPKLSLKWLEEEHEVFL